MKFPSIVKKEDSFLWNICIKEGDIYFKMPVFRRKEEHDHGKWNNTSPDWWLLRDKSALQLALWESDPENKKGHYREPINKLLDEENRYMWVPFGDKYSSITSWSYLIEQYNVIDHYTKYNSDDYSVKKKGLCKMFCDGVEIWSFPTGGDNDWAMAKAKYLSVIIGENEYGFNPKNPDEIIGQKVWYHDQEGVITKHFLPDNRVVIKSEKPDGTGFNLDKNRYSKEDKEWMLSDWHNQMEVHTGFTDTNIYWYRS